jgi:hypothetical protein
VWVRKSVRKSKKEYCRIELWLCNHINPYLGDVLPYMVVPLITYLVSPLLRAVSKKNNPWSFFAIPTPPWLGNGGEAKAALTEYGGKI